MRQLFYEGKNMDMAAHIRFTLKQFAEEFTTTRPGNIYSLLGEIGGAQGLVFTYRDSD